MPHPMPIKVPAPQAALEQKAKQLEQLYPQGISPQQGMRRRPSPPPDRSVLRRPSSASVRGNCGIVPDATATSAPAPAEASAASARPVQGAVPRHSGALRVPTCASYEGRHILARSPRLASDGTTFQALTPAPGHVILPTPTQVHREVEARLEASQQQRAMDESNLMPPERRSTDPWGAD